MYLVQTPGRSSPMADAWCVTGSLVTRSSNFSSLWMISEARFTCSSKTFSSQTKVSWSSSSIKLSVSLWRFSKSWSFSLTWSFKRLIFYWLEGVSFSLSYIEEISRSIPVRRLRTVPWRLLIFAIVSSMVRFAQAKNNQSERSHRLDTIRFEGPMFALWLVPSSPVR